MSAALPPAFVPEQFFLGIFLGGLGVLFATNLVLLCMLRDRAYLFLLVLIAGAGLLVWSPGGLGVPASLLSVPAHGVAQFTVGLSGYLRQLLETRVLAARLDFALLLFGGLTLLFLLVGLLLPAAVLARVVHLLWLPALLSGRAPGRQPDRACAGSERRPA